ncbi:M16 family metallopeptidase [Solilutibacter silvestris]|uniref:Putative Zn-dependent peptidase n=1 Tax=Solilutibacter silvestris TaxID=1645665 RepID=A0A2K1Q0P8_9GAMM|nr:pitrilysin family protein [Lysobacter silvestris]PNS08622.1 putative Zn-dependent peptidase [Lysobacter silvestris]
MTSLKISALACALVIACASATAADFPSTPPAPGSAPKLSIPTPVRQVLANGMEVITVARPGLPLVTAELLLRRGGELDPVGKAGLADLTATLLTKGAGGRNASDLAQAADELGGSLGSSAGWDNSGVGMTVTTPKLAAALSLLADVVEQPTLAQDELDRARAQALDDLRQQLSRPMSMASLAGARLVFGAGAYGHSRTGTPASLARITRDDVVALHAQVYRPDNAVLVLAGDITPQQSLQLAQAAFASWAKPAQALAAAPAGRADAHLPTLLVIDQHGAGQAGVALASPAPDRADPGYFSGQVANAVLGGSYSARLNQEIRIKRGLSYGASSRFDPRRTSGLWSAGAQTKNPSAPQVVDLMRGEALRLGDAAVPADELAARKATLVGDYGRSLQTTQGLAGTVGALAVQGIDLAEVARYVDRVQAVTPAQVRQYAHAHLDPAHSAIVVVGDAGQFGEALRKAHPDAVTIPFDKVDLDSADLRGK